MTEPTNREILDHVQSLTGTVQTLTSNMQSLTGTVQDLTGKVDVLTEMMHAFAVHSDEQHAQIRADMATKDFVDRKVDASEARVIERINRTDEKVGRLVDVLAEKRVLTVEDAHRVITGR